VCSDASAGAVGAGLAGVADAVGLGVSDWLALGEGFGDAAVPSPLQPASAATTTAATAIPRNDRIG
jgi:hypothetical protein